MISLASIPPVDKLPNPMGLVTCACQTAIPSYRRELKYLREEMFELIGRIRKSNLRASIQANRDEAIINYLDALEEALKKHLRADHRRRGIHCSGVDAEIISN